jgi:hypothetical protein
LASITVKLDPLYLQKPEAACISGYQHPKMPLRFQTPEAANPLIFYTNIHSPLTTKSQNCFVRWSPVSASDPSVAHRSVEDRSLFFGHEPQCCRIQNIRNELPMPTFRSQPFSLGVAQPSRGIDLDPSTPSFEQSSFPVRSWRYTIRQKWGLDHLATRIEVIHTERPGSSMLITGPALPRAVWKLALANQRE